MRDSLITDMGNGISCIDSGYTRPAMTACYLLEHNDHVAIIETGVNANVPEICRIIEEKGYASSAVTAIIPTHVHLDHAGGVGALMNHFPNAELLVHPRGARHMINPEKLIAGATAVYGEELFNKHYGVLSPVDESRVKQMPDESMHDFHGRSLLFLDTPGHARHHFCVYDETSKGLFTGDSFGISYPDITIDGDVFGFPTTTPVQFEPDAMHETIDRLCALEPACLFLTHYGPVTQVDKLAAQLHEDIDEFVSLTRQHAHQEEAENQLIDALFAYLSQRLNGRSNLSEEKLFDLLKLDCQLNAQGLLFWYGRNHSN